MFLALWVALAWLLHHVLTDVCQLQTWSLAKAYLFEAVIDVSTLVRLLKLRFGNSKTRDNVPWWR